MKDSGDDQTQRLDVHKENGAEAFRSAAQEHAAGCYLNRGAICMGQLYTLQ